MQIFKVQKITLSVALFCIFTYAHCSQDKKDAKTDTPHQSNGTNTKTQPSIKQTSSSNTIQNQNWGIKFYGAPQTKHDINIPRDPTVHHEFNAKIDPLAKLNLHVTGEEQSAVPVTLAITQQNALRLGGVGGGIASISSLAWQGIGVSNMGMLGLSAAAIINPDGLTEVAKDGYAHINQENFNKCKDCCTTCCGVCCLVTYELGSSCYETVKEKAIAGKDTCKFYCEIGSEVACEVGKNCCNTMKEKAIAGKDTCSDCTTKAVSKCSTFGNYLGGWASSLAFQLSRLKCRKSKENNK